MRPNSASMSIAPARRKLGMTQHDVATDLLISLSGSFQTSPTFWLDPKNGVSYNIVTQTPQYKLDSLEDLRNIPLPAATTGSRKFSARWRPSSAARARRGHRITTCSR